MTKALMGQIQSAFSNYDSDDKFFPRKQTDTEITLVNSANTMAVRVVIRYMPIFVDNEPPRPTYWITFEIFNSIETIFEIDEPIPWPEDQLPRLPDELVNRVYMELDEIRRAREHQRGTEDEGEYGLGGDWWKNTK